MTALSLRGKRVLIRQDFNVPMEAGQMASAKRIEAALDTIRLAVAAGAKVLLMSHMGRPEADCRDPALSLAPVAAYLARALGGEVKLYDDYLTQPPTLADGEVAVLENVRFNAGETANDEELSRQYASLCDIFVMDAFGTAHRAQASTCGVARYAPEVCAGPLLMAELAALGKALERPRRPLVAIVGGAKVSTKLTVLRSLLSRVDRLIPGGGIANTFLVAAGHKVGKSLFEPENVAAARELMAWSAEGGRAVLLPEDVVVAKSRTAAADAVVKSVHELADDDIIFDIGPATAARYGRIIEQAGTLLWNGPVGVFEVARFAAGTEYLGRAIARSGAFSIAGGGETLAAIERFDLDAAMSCVSTGGGAFLEFLAGKTLPALAALEFRSAAGEAPPRPSPAPSAARSPA